MKKGQIDFQLLLIVVVLLGIGTVMIFSASAPWAYDHNGTPYYYLIRQLIFVGIGSVGMFVAAMFDYRKYKNISLWILLVGFILMTIILLPGIGKTVNGSRRWLNLSVASFQPSEFMKLAVIISFAAMLSKKNVSLEKLKDLIPYGIILVGIMGVLYLQNHMSAGVVMVAIAAIMMFVGGLRWRHILLAGTLVASGFTAMILLAPFRVTRVLNFLDPLNDETMKEGTWQIANSLMAIGSGGLFGKGLGKSVQKYLYIPEPHNDFIFAIVAEELGFVGCVIILLLFAFLIYKGYTIAYHAQDKFGSYMAVGITSLIAIQLLINVAVVTSVMPVTGMSLPFFSYGGTSLLFLMYEVGILLNISKTCTEKRVEKKV